jgi:outer membrane lipoprotein-sorting protein
MISPLLRVSLAATSAFVLSVSAAAAEPAILTKARAYLGSDSALENVKSVHFVGTLVTKDPTDPIKDGQAQIDIVFQKPDLQRIVATSDKLIEITALDGYDGWQRFQDAKDETKWQQTLLGTEQVKRLRANTWQNLFFYRGIERTGGMVEDQGPATIDGIACQKIAFVHSAGIVFTRYFEIATGRLVFTETDGGNSTMRESGEIRVDGIRFPKSVIQTTKAGNVTRTATITFDKVTLNETFPTSIFATPRIRPASANVPTKK